MGEPTDSAVDVFNVMFARARTGDQDAWRELFNASYDKVLRVIRRRLNNAAMRSLFDSTDFLGDVWKSLAEKPEHFDFQDFDALLAFLSKAAERKVIDQYRRMHALKYDIERHRPIGGWEGLGGNAPDFPSHDPTPSQVALATEAEETLLSGRTGDDRRVIELKQQGFSNDEVAHQTGWSLRKVQRFLKGLSDSWIARTREGPR